MKAAIAIAVLAACGGGGGGKTKPTVGNDDTAPPKVAAKDPWQAINEGRTFTFTAELGSGFDPVTLTATVARVESTGDARTIHLEWIENGRSLDIGGGPPATFTITGDRVIFVDENLEFPLARQDRKPDGREVNVHDDGTVCYTDGPGEGAGDCEDVCFSDFCVDPEIGLIGGAGLWWPGYAPFQRSDLR